MSVASTAPWTCCWCLGAPTRRVTSSGWPICGDCWNDGDDAYTPSTYRTEQWSAA